MRKLLSFFVVLTSFFFFSCSSEEDIRSDGSLPFYLNVYIEDAEGNSYLNPEHERCINLDKSKVYSVLEDGSLKLHSDDDYQYNDYATDENGNPIKYRVFSKCFEYGLMLEDPNGKKHENCFVHVDVGPKVGETSHTFIFQWDKTKSDTVSFILSEPYNGHGYKYGLISKTVINGKEGDPSPVLYLVH